jgi:chromosomal replication initiation ATPase DnaA
MTDLDTVKAIIKIVSAEAGVSVDEFLSLQNRVHRVCKYRDDAIYLAREHTQMGYQELAKLFDCRHHTTLVSSYRKVKMRRDRGVVHRNGMKWSDWHNYLMAKVAQHHESGASK